MNRQRGPDPGVGPAIGPGVGPAIGPGVGPAAGPRVGLMAAVVVEARKAVSGRVVRATTGLLVAGIVLLAGSLTAAAQAGNQDILAQLGPLADATGWELFTGVAIQVTAAGGLLGFGVMLSWSVGREFAEGTIAGLFALPISRSRIAAAKLTVYLGWSVMVAIGLVALIAVTGVLLRLGPLTGADRAALLRLFVLTVLSALAALPAAWAATLGRGLLPGIATAIGVIVTAQVMVVAGTGGWYPFAAPALWALEPAAVDAGQLLLAAVVPLLFAALTTHAWGRLQLDR